MLAKNKKRAERRFQTNRIQLRRIKKIYSWYLPRGNEPLSEGQKGYLRSGHWGCGCRQCKPYKHGIGPKDKPSLLRKISPSYS